MPGSMHSDVQHKAGTDSTLNRREFLNLAVTAAGVAGVSRFAGAADVAEVFLPERSATPERKSQWSG